MVEIERGVPMPADAVRAAGVSGKPAVYPFGDMQVGDSFSLPEDRASAAIEAAKKWRQRHPGWEHAWVREGGRIRMWRTA